MVLQSQPTLRNPLSLQSCRPYGQAHEFWLSPPNLNGGSRTQTARLVKATSTTTATLDCLQSFAPETHLRQQWFTGGSLAILQHWNKWPHTSLSTPSSQGPSSQTSTSSTATTRTTTASTAATNSGTNHYQQVTAPVFKETRNPVASPRGRQEIAPPPMHPAVEISEEADTSSEDLVASMLVHQVQDDEHSNMSHYDYLQRSNLSRKKSFSNWTTALKTERGT